MQNHTVINIGRQLGSGGRSVGELLADRLKIPFYDKQLLNMAAVESGIAPELFERVDEVQSYSLFTTLVGYLRAPFAGYEGGNANNPLSNEALFKVQSDVIRRAAASGPCIFIGRCADYILRDRPCTLSLFLTADDDDRIARLCAAHGCTADEARTLMHRTDSRRAAYYNYFTDRTWGAAATYDLTLNTSRLGVEGTADFILEFAARKFNLKY